MITLSNDVIAADAPKGTVIGLLGDTRGSGSTFSLLYTEGLPLGIVGDELVTGWTGSVTIKAYSIAVLAVGGSPLIDFGIKTVTVEKPKAAKMGLELTNVSTHSQTTPTKRGP